jgi:hypothetical protein
MRSSHRVRQPCDARLPPRATTVGVQAAYVSACDAETIDRLLRPSCSSISLGREALAARSREVRSYDLERFYGFMGRSLRRRRQEPAPVGGRSNSGAWTWSPMGRAPRSRVQPRRPRCRLRLRDWLEQLRASVEARGTRPRLAPKDEAPSPSTPDRNACDLMTAPTADVPTGAAARTAAAGAGSALRVAPAGGQVEVVGVLPAARPLRR